MATVNLSRNERGVSKHVSDSATKTSDQGRTAATKQFHGRMKFDAEFCPTDVDSPFDTAEWEIRTSAIKGENGEVLFEQDNCEVPTFWSQLATNVVRHPEFAEGVRALLIDKDRNPAWQYQRSRDVPAEVLEGFFTAPWETNPLADLG